MDSLVAYAPPRNVPHNDSHPSSTTTTTTDRQPGAGGGPAGGGGGGGGGGPAINPAGPIGALLGMTGLAYGAYNSVYTVEGGHRALLFNRLVGVKEEVQVRVWASDGKLCWAAPCKGSMRGPQLIDSCVFLQ
jgi:hypothetical protein